MRKIREVLRLKFDCGLSVRKIARSLGTGHSSAGDYLWPATINLTGRRQLSWPVGSAAGKVRKRGIECSSDDRRWEALGARQEDHGPTSAQIQ
jgi:hypothetical protein